MSASVKLEGVDQLLRQMTDAPREIREEGREILRACTEGAASDLSHRLPVGKTGNLRKGVKTRYPSSAALIGIVENFAPHSHLWHWGTRQRETRTRANRGRMTEPSPEPLVTTATKWRRILQTRLMAMLQDKGFVVSEE